MDNTHLSQFLPTAIAGLGLLLVGGVNIALLRLGRGARGVATLLAIGVTLTGAWALDQPRLVERTSWLLGGGLLACVVLSSRWLVIGLASAITSLRNPVVRFGALSLGGLVTLIVTIVICETRDENILRLEGAELEFTHSQIPTTVDQKVKSATDRGSTIPLRLPTAARDEGTLGAAEDRFLRGVEAGNYLIRRGPATDNSNCHGWVFTGGRYLLSGEDVNVILKENGYEEVHEPHPGDLVVYRGEGTVKHTAIIRYVTEGQSVMVEGKWGVLGTYLHPAERSIYGLDYAFYRSPRQGHLLAGVPSSPAGEPRTTAATE